ncbi:hypothetical protein BH10ACI4_BH10ACI4_21550 [soil metagenome]
MTNTHRTYPLDEQVDAVVIGTGAGGAPLLHRLAQAGLRVVALEAGQSWPNPAADFATDEIAQSKLYWLDERLSDGQHPTAFGANNSGIGVGGSTLHYGAYVPRADPRDLRLRSQQGVAVDWPVDYSELTRYYQQVETFLGVSGPSPYPWDPSRTYPLPPLALNTAAHIMQRGCSELGIKTSPAPIAALSQPYLAPGSESRQPCVHRGYCHQGCRNGAKASMDVTYLPAALACGAEIREQSFVTGIERNSEGHITAVLHDRNGVTERQRCNAVFLCAGAVETPRQLLLWDVANSSDQVGRNFMAHVSTQVWATFPEQTFLYRGFPSTLITEDLMRPSDADFAGGYLVQSYGILPIMWAEQVARSRPLFGQQLVDYLMQYPHVSGLGINGETLPNPDNRITLSAELDARGLPKPRITLTLGENEERLHLHADRTMRAILTAAGGSDLWTSRRTAHTIGTCRMGTDASNSVVNPYGQSWDIPNLWIADNSVFPTSLAANPALTIMALARRTADKFLESHSSR